MDEVEQQLSKQQIKDKDGYGMPAFAGADPDRGGAVGDGEQIWTPTVVAPLTSRSS